MLPDVLGKEAFISALNHGHLQLEVMKREPFDTQTARNCAVKIEAYEQSLVTQGTLTSDDDRGKRRSRAVNAVSDKSDGGLAIQKCMDELQEMLEKVTKGIAALAAQSGAVDKGKNTRDSDAKSTSPKKGTWSRGSGRISMVVTSVDAKTRRLILATAVGR